MNITQETVNKMRQWADGAERGEADSLHNIRNFWRAMSGPEYTPMSDEQSLESFRMMIPCEITPPGDTPAVDIESALAEALEGLLSFGEFPPRIECAKKRDWLAAMEKARAALALRAERTKPKPLKESSDAE